MLELQDLHVALDAESGVVRPLDALDLTVRRGETVALVGESGCGKSMTALAAMRLLPDNGVVTQGDVRLGGEDLLAMPEAAMRGVRGARVGMIFQEPATSLNPVMRIGDQIVEAIEAHAGLRGAAARARAIEWLRRVGIPQPEQRIDDYPFRLSGGQKQRVMIAMVLAAEPEFIVADEPTTALDVTIQAQVLELLRELQRERGLGLLLITHDLAVVAGMADRIALMYAGQIVESAPAAAFFARPRHPYAELLLAALPDSARRGEPLAAIAGTVPPLDRAFDGCRFAERCPAATAWCRTSPPPLEAAAGAGAAGGHAVRCWLDRGLAGGPVRVDALAALAAQPRANGGPVHLKSEESADTSASMSTDTSAARAAEDSGHAAALLVVRDLSVGFPVRRGLFHRTVGHFEAVKSVSLSVGRGRTLALVGESGCGKTTLGKAIVQLLRGSARIEGQALLDGQDLFALKGEALRAARRQVQIVFQDPFASLNPRLRVAEILEEGLRALRPDLDPDARQRAIGDIVEQVGLRRDALVRFPHEFSGGQRQRIAIARTLAVQPKLIVCDEPTSALDVSVQAQILNLLAQLQRDTGVSLLFITHNIGVVEYLADEVAVMRGGSLVEVGSVAQVLGRPRSDYTRELLAAVPRLR
jgi:peptide/nickel transport system ATP-binding protein